ncbi:hypothetical protein [Allostreptomyces psammosilenae]|uniref:Uncharacterized protein n=1 Tax=Allostreptomyces psammosilenae TaxID=1892865 RepID=A0A852ZXY2_9ACTN|nr:hypothetical protein [Allostreptomyces psammosilenae]NYI07039.1 hypothetical protein [Allostreptomyces psammosilenae]
MLTAGGTLALLLLLPPLLLPSPPSAPTASAPTAAPGPSAGPPGDTPAPDPLGPAALQDALDRWDGPARTVRGTHALVVGPPGRRAALEAYAVLADAAAEDVARLLALPAPPPLIVYAPTDNAALARLAGGEPGAHAHAAAVTVTRDPTGGTPRVLLGPTAFDALTDDGRRFVLTHEAVHAALALRDGGGPPAGMPRWLDEGVADWVAVVATGLTERELAAPLAERLARQGPPERLPADAAFDSASADADLAYAEARLACAMVVRDHGPAALPALRTATAEALRAGQDGAAALDTAMRAVLDTDPATFTERWQHYLTSELLPR